MADKQPFYTKLFNPLLNRLGYINKSDRKALALLPTLNNSIWSGTPVIDPKMGVKKPGNIAFETLRRIAKADSVTRICINVIKKDVSQSEYEFVSTKGNTHVDQSKVTQLETLFDNVNTNGENIRVFWDKLLEDLLVLDAGVFEKVYNAKGELVEMVVVDGATIRPVYNVYGEMDPNRAYVQVIANKVVAEFKLSEIVYMMQSPQNDVRHFGYGMSPIESILLSIQSSLQADLYNAQTFTKDNIPPGILDLGDMTNAEAKAFIAEWNATVIDSNQKLKFVWNNVKGGPSIGKRYIPFQQNNKDMQFVEYTEWLSRIKLSVYGLSSVDANLLQDVNRATATVQRAISQSRGVMAVKRLIEEYFNREIIRPMGITDVEFRFKRITNLEEKKMQADVDKIYLDTGVISPSEIAEREGFSGVDMFTDENFEPEEPTVPETQANPDVIEQTATANKSKKPYYRPLYS